MDRERFNPDTVDWDDPFEIDAVNEPHLFAHAPYGADDLYDMLVFLPRLIEADTRRGDADWFLVGQPPGCPPLVSPLSAPDSGDSRKVRPIGIYEATGDLLAAYLEGRGDEL